MALRRALRANIAFAILMMLIVCAAVAGLTYVIHRQKSTALAEALAHSSLRTRAFEEHLSRSLETVQRLVEFMVVGSKPEEMNAHLRLALRQVPFLRSLSLLDDGGRIVASSNDGNVGLRVATGDYYPPELFSDTAALRIGLPWAGRDFVEGEPVSAANPLPADGLGFIPVLCRARSRDGTVRIMAALNPDSILNYFTQWLTPDEGFAEVLRYDLVLLLTTGTTVLTGGQHGDRVLARLLREAEIGRYHGEQEGTKQTVTAFRAARHFPLVVVTHLYRDQALAGWRQECGRMLLLAIPALLAVFYLAAVLYRRQQRVAAEREAVRRHDYERLAATVFETVLEAVVVTDGERRIVAVNPAFTRITGYSAEEVVGADLSLLASGYHTDEFLQAMQHSLATQGRWEGEVRNRRKNGEIFVAWQSISQVRDDSGRIVHQVTGLSDITDYCAEAERISHLAHHDLLTGLPNRALLLDRLRQGIRQAHRDSRHLVLLFLDLDKFKPVNDRLGHTVGDRLLQVLADRLRREVRAADTLARLGGDEFVVVLHAVKNIRAGAVVAEKVRRAVEQPFLIGAHTVTVSASIGVAVYPDHAEDEERLLACADKAMYRAKAAGGNRFEVWREGGEE